MAVSVSLALRQLFSLSKAVYSVLTLFSLSSASSKQINLCISEPKRCFVCLSLFLTTQLQRVYDWNLRSCATLMGYCEQWCYTCLSGSIARQTSVENRDGATVYSVSFHNRLGVNSLLKNEIIRRKHLYLINRITQVIFRRL